jgi:glutamate-1-semialdehyde 2,1-aminomutase
LGYGHPGVEEAYLAQARKPASSSFFSPLLVELVEALVDRYAGLDWGVVAKTGSEVVTLAGRVARRATGRSLIVAFTGAYHGSDAELAPGAPAPAPGADRVLRIPWNDAAALRRLADERGGEIAAILLNGLDQTPFRPTRFAEPEFIAAIEETRTRWDVVSILDDVRHGFRLHPEGSHVALGLQPDLLCLGKGLGNGHSVSALLGRDALREGVRGILFTSSLHFEQPPMRAAIATLEAYDDEDAFAAMTRAGSRLEEGLRQAARDTGHAIDCSGPPTMPTLLFENDPDHTRIVTFAREAARRGAIFHPALNWFLCAAHDDSSIDQALEIAHAALRATPSHRATPSS